MYYVTNLYFQARIQSEILYMASDSRTDGHCADAGLGIRIAIEG